MDTNYKYMSDEDILYELKLSQDPLIANLRDRLQKKIQELEMVSAYLDGSLKIYEELGEAVNLIEMVIARLPN